LEVLERHIDKFNLRCKEVNSQQARMVVMKGRQCLSRFSLNEKNGIILRNFLAKIQKEF
jgi:hypothetical protein